MCVREYGVAGQKCSGFDETTGITYNVKCEKGLSCIVPVGIVCPGSCHGICTPIPTVSPTDDTVIEKVITTTSGGRNTILNANNEACFEVGVSFKAPAENIAGITNPISKVKTMLDPYVISLMSFNTVVFT